MNNKLQTNQGWEVEDLELGLTELDNTPPTIRFLDDAQILVEMRQDGLSDDTARETLEVFNCKTFTHAEWAQVQYYADGEQMRLTELHN